MHETGEQVRNQRHGSEGRRLQNAMSPEDGATMAMTTDTGAWWRATPPRVGK